ncbi:MAG: type II toxin-antitoxin system Phd/YefM family antitoxin [Deferrisomatales bacterium]
MLETTIAELRKHTREYFDSVEKGEVVRVLRRGQPIAEISPIRRDQPAWSRPVDRLVVPGLSLSQEILKDRAVAEE